LRPYACLFYSGGATPVKRLVFCFVFVWGSLRRPVCFPQMMTLSSKSLLDLFVMQGLGRIRLPMRSHTSRALHHLGHGRADMHACRTASRGRYQIGWAPNPGYEVMRFAARRCTRRYCYEYTSVPKSRGPHAKTAATGRGVVTSPRPGFDGYDELVGWQQGLLFVRRSHCLGLGVGGCAWLNPSR
jgi:hypothetical protein